MLRFEKESLLSGQNAKTSVTTGRRIGCVVLAAGLSSRFGSNKLLAEYEGRSLICRTFDAVPVDKLSHVVVVTCYPEVRALAEENGFKCAWNDEPEKGASLSVRIGLDLLLDTDAVLFMVSDQAALTRESVSAQVDFYRMHPDHIVRMSCDGQVGNPCIFPSAFFPELLELQGDTGGRAIIRRHEDSTLNFCISNAAELADVDYNTDLKE